MREIITLPGFSWDKKLTGKPLKNVAFAFRDHKLYFCISPSTSNFSIEKGGQLLFIKTVGGQKRKGSEPKQIFNVSGNFNDRSNNAIFLQLHFGKSYARRYLFHKHWGLFSKSPKIFLNNARLKREKNNPGDKWQYYLDVTLSGERVFGYKDFAGRIHSFTKAVIGIDRGEVNPISYSVIRLLDGEIIESGFLAVNYIPKLKEYVSRKREYQSKSKTIPKYLKSKVSRLQETLLETASSEVLAMVGRFQGVVAIEKLDRRFKGSERRIIPKKTYLKIEQLLTDSLQLAGVLRISDDPKNYWGGLLTVNPAGTSLNCPNCNCLWNKDYKSRIVGQAIKRNFENIDFHTAKMIYEDGDNDITIKLNDYFNIYDFRTRKVKRLALNDIALLIKHNELKEAEKYLYYAIGPRISQDRFICAVCGYSNHADLVGAINISRRGMESILRLTKQK